MGNSPMTIGLKVDGDEGGHHHIAGSSLKGTVYLSVTGKTAVADSIRLRVSGEENVVLHHTTTEDRIRTNSGRRDSDSSEYETITVNHYERSTDTLLDVDHLLNVFPNGQIPPGQYEFPFTLRLPTSLPSTLSLISGESTCEVKYVITAEVYVKPNSFMYSNPSTKKIIQVAAQSPITPDCDTSLQLPIEIVPINRCCCCYCTRQGTIALETKFEKTTLFTTATTSTSINTYRRNENDSNLNSVMVQFRCQNKSTAKVRSVQVQLIERIDWNCNGHSESVRKVLVESNKDAELYPELDALRRKPSRFSRQQDESSETHMLLHSQPWNTIVLNVPPDASDTYRSQGVQVRHSLVVQLKTTGWCATNLDISTVVQIYRNTTAPSSSFMGMGDNHDPLSCEQQNHTIPSAPFEDEIIHPSTTMSQQLQPAAATATTAATAPSDVYDYNYDNNNSGYSNKNEGNNDNNNNTDNYFASIPTVEAQIVLPEDWNAQTAEVVDIPMAEAKFLP